MLADETVIAVAVTELVTAELVVNNPENTYCICITPKAFLAVDSKRKWNLGPLKKKTPVTFI